MSIKVELKNKLCYIHTWDTTQQQKNELLLHNKTNFTEIMPSERNQTLWTVLYPPYLKFKTDQSTEIDVRIIFAGREEW